MDRANRLPAGRHCLYPWQQWLQVSSAPYTLRKGVHYQCSSYQMAAQIRDKSRSGRYGKIVTSVRVSDDEQHLTVLISSSEKIGEGAGL